MFESRSGHPLSNADSGTVCFFGLSQCGRTGIKPGAAFMHEACRRQEL